jgi:hypothetical protein
MEGWLVPLAFFAMIAFIVAASVWGNVQNKRAVADTIKRAIENGQQLDAETISSLSKPARSWQQDMRGGIILMFLAAGFVIAGLLGPGGGDDVHFGNGFFIAAVIIGAIGLGQLVAALMRRPKKVGE